MYRRRFLIAGGALAASGVAAVGRRAPDGSGRAHPSALVAGSLQALAARAGGASVEAHGSVAARRLVVEGARNPDALALADPDLFRGVSDRYTLFATNALVIAYDDDSAHAGALRDDWRAALSDPELDLGRTDPELDPLGYRTIMAFELAEGVDSDAVLDRAPVFPEVALLRNLEAGAIDAAVAYRNMAVEHDLPFAELPPEIDLSDPARADDYATASVDIAGRTVRGAPIRYGVHALSAAGGPWASDLASDAGRLRDAGFGVPDAYPRTVTSD